MSQGCWEEVMDKLVFFFSFFLLISGQRSFTAPYGQLLEFWEFSVEFGSLQREPWVKTNSPSEQSPQDSLLWVHFKKETTTSVEKQTCCSSWSGHFCRVAETGINFLYHPHPLSMNIYRISHRPGGFISRLKKRLHPLSPSPHYSGLSCPLKAWWISTERH